MSKSGKVAGLPVVHARAAGIDIGSRIQVVAVPPELNNEPVRTFQGFTADIALPGLEEEHAAAQDTICTV